MTMQGVRPLTQLQHTEYRDRYIKPYIQLIVENLDEIKDLDQKCTLLKQLVDLVCYPLTDYTPAELAIKIHDGTQEFHTALNTAIEQILKTTPAISSSGAIYHSLYHLFHEYRLNKSPDPADIEERLLDATRRYPNAFELDNHYDDIPKKVGTIIERFRVFGRKDGTDDPSMEVLDAAFCDIAQNSIIEFQLDLLTPPVAVPSTSKDTYEVGSNPRAYQPLYAARANETEEDRIKRERKEQEDRDAAMAALMQEELYQLSPIASQTNLAGLGVPNAYALPRNDDSTHDDYDADDDDDADVSVSFQRQEQTQAKGRKFK